MKNKLNIYYLNCDTDVKCTAQNAKLWISTFDAVNDLIFRYGLESGKRDFGRAEPTVLTCSTVTKSLCIYLIEPFTSDFIHNTISVKSLSGLFTLILPFMERDGGEYYCTKRTWYRLLLLKNKLEKLCNGSDDNLVTVINNKLFKKAIQQIQDFKYKAHKETIPISGIAQLAKYLFDLAYNLGLENRKPEGKLLQIIQNLYKKNRDRIIVDKQNCFYRSLILHTKLIIRDNITDLETNIL